MASVTPGTSTTYTIVATNLGPNAVAGASVVDTPPAGVTFTGWTCVASAGSACGNPSGSGPINELVTLLNGGNATYTVTAAVASGATGTISNTATVTAPATVVDPNSANNTATDTDTLTPVADLAITKTDGVATIVPGSGIAYTIVASNAGPSTAVGATVADTFPAAITRRDLDVRRCRRWHVSRRRARATSARASTCRPAARRRSPSSARSPRRRPVHSSTPRRSPRRPASPIRIRRTIRRPTPTRSTPTADLAITKTDGVATVTPGAGITYTIVASNAGPSNAIGATVTDTLPAAILGATWTCAGAGGGTCPASGSGNINASVNLPAGASVTFTLSGTVSAAATGTLVNTATVTAPAGVTDPNPGNNSATDTDTLDADRRPRDHEDRRRRERHAGRRRHLHDRRVERGAERGDGRDGGGHAAGVAHRRDVDVRRRGRRHVSRVGFGEHQRGGQPARRRARRRSR